MLCTPNGIRTRVVAVKGRCPRPLDDGSVAPDYTMNPMCSHGIHHAFRNTIRQVPTYHIVLMTFFKS